MGGDPPSVRGGSPVGGDPPSVRGGSPVGVHLVVYGVYLLLPLGAELLPLPSVHALLLLQLLNKIT